MNVFEWNGRIYFLILIDLVVKCCIFILMIVVCVFGFFGNVLVVFYLKVIKNKW